MNELLPDDLDGMIAEGRKTVDAHHEAVLRGDKKEAAKQRQKFGDLRTIVETAWKWHQAHPRGFA